MKTVLIVAGIIVFLVYGFVLYCCIRVGKDDVVTFEQLGVDRLFVDESHSFKNLFLDTKMRNVAGISQTDAQKSSDMFMKCRYMDELTGGRGITFATGTPVSNSIQNRLSRIEKYYLKVIEIVPYHGKSETQKLAEKI